MTILFNAEYNKSMKKAEWFAQVLLNSGESKRQVMDILKKRIGELEDLLEDTSITCGRSEIARQLKINNKLNDYCKDMDKQS